VVSFTPLPLYPRVKEPPVPFGVDPRASLDDDEKRKFLPPPGLELPPLGLPGRSQSLYRLRYPGSQHIRRFFFKKRSKYNYQITECIHTYCPKTLAVMFFSLAYAELISKFTAFYRIQRFIIIFIRVRSWTLSCAR
jgi:hypothetical protein